MPMTISGDSGLTFPDASVQAKSGTQGVVDGSNAAAGQIGEYVESVVLQGSPISLTTATNANITSISLTAGDWDVSGAVAFATSGTTSVTVLIGAFNTTSVTLPASPERFSYSTAANVPGSSTSVYAVPTRRFSLAATTTVYLIAQGSFTASTLTAYGRISARRIR